jgi:hypothetical protein
LKYNPVLAGANIGSKIFTGKTLDQHLGVGGKDYAGEAAKARAAAREKAVIEGDFEGYRMNAESGFSAEQVTSAFHTERASSIMTGKAKNLNELDLGLPAFANRQRTGVGPVTIAPVTNVVVHASGEMAIGEIEMRVRKVSAESAQQAAAALRRGKQ